MKSQLFKKCMPLIFLFLIFSILVPALCNAWNPFGYRHRRSGEENCRLLIQKVRDIAPYTEGIFEEAAGWAVFPKISKAGIGIGAAAGNGRVYKSEKFIGTATMMQASFGFQLGGKVYGEIIFFQDEKTFKRFQSGKFELNANVSAVIIDKGAAREIGFKNGMAVFIIPGKGLMYEAAVAGQKFTFKKSR